MEERNKYHSTTNDIELAVLYTQTNKLDQAIGIYKALTERYPDNGKAWRLLRDVEEKLHKLNPNQIIKSISFKKEHQKAGITILQNLGTLLNEKSPEGGVSFSITQENLRIVMVIEHPEGKKEIVEDYLNRYGLVVTGKISPEEFSSDPLMVLDLKRQLIQVESDLKWSNEKQKLLTNTINEQDRYIESLSNQLEYFQNQLTNTLSNNHIEIEGLLALLNRGDNQAESLMQPLINSINNKDSQETKRALDNIKSNDNPLFKRLNDLILNTVASTGANVPAWINYLSKIIP